MEVFQKVLALYKEGKFSEMDELLEDEAAREKAPAVAAASAVVDAGQLESQFLPGHDYRVNFKNGCSGEYAGAALAHHFPFDPEQVDTVERIG